MKLINGSAAPVQTGTVLDRVAMALGCSVEALSNPTSRDPDATVELLRLWAAIKDDQDRQKVLSFVRTIVP